MNNNKVTADDDEESSAIQRKMESLSIEEGHQPVPQTSGETTLIEAFETGNDEIIQEYLKDCNFRLAEKDLEILFKISIETRNLSIVIRLLINGIQLNASLQNSDSVLNKNEGLKLRQYILLLMEKDDIFSFKKLTQEENIEFLHQFVESGIQVNVKDSKGYNCLHYVLEDREERHDLVKYLVEKGADVNSASPKGSPCLLLAAARCHFKICKYLITKGADINGRNSKQKTMLHIVSRKSRFYDTVSVAKLLVNAGADVNALDDRKFSPIMIAAIEYNERAVDYYSTVPQISNSAKTSAYEVIGAMFNSKDTATKYWTKALVTKGGELNDGETFDDFDDNSILPNVKEVSSIKTLKEIAANEESRLFQSVYLLDKHLGRHNSLTLKKLKTLARSYLKTENGERKGSSVIKHALCKVLQVRKCIFKDSAKVDALYDILCCWCYYCKDKQSISFTEISEIFYFLVEQLDILGNELTAKQLEIPVSSLDLVYEVFSVLFALNKSAADLEMFSRISKFFIKTDKKFHHVFGRSVLHITVQNRIHYFFPTENDQKYSLAKFLVCNGISVNAFDRRKNTPLHLVLKDSVNPIRNEIVKMLLDSGAHIDCCNEEGEMPVSLMKKCGIDFCELTYRSLQCLCAMVIKRYGLSVEEMPKHLKSFIDLH